MILETAAKFAPIATALIALVASCIALCAIRAQRDIARRRAAIDFFLKTEMDDTVLKLYKRFKPLLEWAHGRGMELTLIEVMPLGDVGEGRLDQYLPLSIVRARLGERFTLSDIDYRTGGPARYVNVAETGGRLGFITPLTHNFCESCNRVRVTCTGTLYMCLGQEDAADLRTPLRASEGNDLLDAAIAEAISRKPKGHDFIIDRRHQRPALSRHMNVTGG